MIKLTEKWPGVHHSVSHFPHSFCVKWVRTVLAAHSCCEGKIGKVNCECLPLAQLNCVEKGQRTCPPYWLPPEEPWKKGVTDYFCVNE